MSKPEQSRWTADRTAYVTPTGERVRVWNGATLYGHRNSVQQKAQREIQGRSPATGGIVESNDAELS